MALVIAACAGVVDATHLEPSEAAAQAGGGGAGGRLGGDCIDRWSTGGAVHIAPAVPAPGSWCPHEGFELCTDRAPIDYALNIDPAFTADAGAGGPPAILSRCVDQHWQTFADASCEPTAPSTPPYEECNVFSYRDPDGTCCVDVRNCERAFCDGQRWWTRR